VRRQATTVPLFLVDCDRLLSGERHDRVRLLTRFHNVFYRVKNGYVAPLPDLVLCLTPNSVTYPWSVCKWGTSGAAQQSEYIKADSYHPGGVNVLFADGSVRFVKDSVNATTWMALGTRANGEVISADSY